jgi:predicted helicase
VVNFIIRAIDDILKSEFAIPDGLADHKRVTMLDFATGTGTFILEALEKMFETIGDSPAKRDLVVREHILKNIFGFEYLIAPYTIAHLKLSQYLADKGHKLAGAERLQIYLTNTLEPIAPQSNFLLPALSAEADKAQEIKQKPILVITGNPPYSGHSKNNGAWISAQINKYKVVDGKPLGEKNPKWLNDDYVKFIRFAQDKIDKVPEGIVGIITNHSFLDNPTFRGMRQSLMASFDKIYVMDLHGNAKKKEKSPDGTKDENVFDIEQGVAISLFIKTKNPKFRNIRRADLWGTRLGKYESCSRLSIGGEKPTPSRPGLSEPNTPFEVASLHSAGMIWRDVNPTTPSYLFERGDAALETVYRQGVSVTEIFPVNVLGFQSHRDDFAIAFSKSEIEKRLFEMCDPNLSDVTIKERYHLKDNRDWNLENARFQLRQNDSWKINVITCSYRPFDYRWCLFGTATMDYPRRELINNVVGKSNICLNTVRQTKSEHWRHSMVSNSPAPAVFVEIKDGSNIFPLYLYSVKATNENLFDQSSSAPIQDKTENISVAFRADVNSNYGTPPVTPEQIFGYIYAILHAPTYRARYAEFLRGDFPRIPLTATRANFEALSALGWDLAQKHLLKSIPKNPVQFLGKKGEMLVEKPRYSEIEKAVYINETNYFAPVPEPVWNFHIGGYQVIEKYLKSRKGRTLTLDEVTTIENIVAVLAFTITQMEAIDTAYKSAFPAQSPTGP